MSKDNLDKARKIKNDEFYTRIEDIEKELRCHLIHKPYTFKNKRILCPCDDYRHSKFVRWFERNRKSLRYKSVTSTCLEGRLQRMDGATGRVIRSQLSEGEGDFSSETVRELFSDSDIIVTNPPFSLFRKFIAQIFEFKREFLILAPLNSINTVNVEDYWTYDKIRVGYKPISSPIAFEPGVDKLFHNVFWVTNLPVHKNLSYPFSTGYENLSFDGSFQKFLIRNYGKVEYPKYDNFPGAIDVPFVRNIPTDFHGVMGVPVTFVEWYDPERFYLLGESKFFPRHNLYLTDKEGRRHKVFYRWFIEWK